MTVIRPERLGDVSQAAAAEFEGELQDVVRKNVSFWRKRPDGSHDGAETINAVIERVAGASLSEIDRAIAELEEMRETLRSEGTRVQQEIAGYANLSQTAMASVKVIAESLAHWRRPAPEPMHHEAG